MLSKILLGVLVGLLGISVVGCGSGDGEATTPRRADLDPSNFQLELIPTKTVILRWEDNPLATRYQVLESLDDGRTYNQVGEDIDQGVESYSFRIPLFLRVDAKYKLATCNEQECFVPGYSETLTRTELNQAVGYIKGSDTVAGDTFGTDVSLSADGKTMAVGANSKSSIADSAGAVYIFKLESGQWVEKAIIAPASLRTEDYFGVSVSLSDDGKKLAVGAKGDDISVGGVFPAKSKPMVPPESTEKDNYGAVYVFSENSAGAWEEVAYIKADYPRKSVQFGEFVSLSGDGSTLAVGAYYDDDPANGINTGDTVTLSFESESADYGSVHVFVDAGSSWEKQAEIRPQAANESANFGSSIELSETGDRLVVGSGIAGLVSPLGRAYAFSRDQAGQWSQDNFYREIINKPINVAISDDGKKIITYEWDDGIQSSKVNTFIFSSAGWTLVEDESFPVVFSSGFSPFVDKYEITISGNGQCIVIGDNREDERHKGINGEVSGLDEPSRGAGAVFVYKKDSGGGWVQKSYLKTIGAIEANESFGRRIAVDDDCGTIAVTEIGNNSNFVGVNGTIESGPAKESGAVFLF